MRIDRISGATVENRRTPPLVRRLLGWWLRELGDLMKTDRRPRRSGAVVDIIVDGAGGQTALSGRLGRDKSRWRRIPLGAPADQPLDQRVVTRRPPRRGPTLRLPERMTLSRRIALPRQAEAQLDGLLRYELNDRMPFAAADAYFAHRIVARSKDRLIVEIVCAERDRVDRLRDQLAAVGLDPARATTPDGAIALLDAAADNATVDTVLNVALVAAALLVAGLGYTVLAIPLERYREAIEQLAPRAEAARAAAAETQRLDAALALRQDERRTLANALDRNWPRLAIVNEIARITPDGAWLANLEIVDDELKIVGLAESATPLIAAFAASPFFDQPHFPAPITRDERENVERFELRATITPRPQ